MFREQSHEVITQLPRWQTIQLLLKPLALFHDLLREREIVAVDFVKELESVHTEER